MHYGLDVQEVVGLEPAAGLRQMAQRAAGRAAIPVALIAASAEAIPVDTHGIDTVVSTWTLCSMADGHRALTEMRRVLKPKEQLVLVEHGLSSGGARARLAGSPHTDPKEDRRGLSLEPPDPRAHRATGFLIDHLETGYAKGRKPMTYHYEGLASPM